MKCLSKVQMNQSGNLFELNWIQDIQRENFTNYSVVDSDGNMIFEDGYSVYLVHIVAK